jgi:hypothetical protein
MDHTIKEILKITLRMDMESILMLTDICIKDNGKIIFQMEKDKLSIQMVADIMDSFLIIKDMVKGY